MAYKPKISLLDFETSSPQDRQLRILRDVIQESLNPQDRNKEKLTDLFLKEVLTPKEKVLAVFYKLMPQKISLKLRKKIPLTCGKYCKTTVIRSSSMLHKDYQHPLNLLY